MWLDLGSDDIEEAAGQSVAGWQVESCPGISYKRLSGGQPPPLTSNPPPHVHLSHIAAAECDDEQVWDIGSREEIEIERIEAARECKEAAGDYKYKCQMRVTVFRGKSYRLV